MTVSLADPNSVSARYDTGERTGAQIIPSRSFGVVLSSDTQKLRMIFAGHDPESGINHLNWTLSIRFQCINERGTIGRGVTVALNGNYHAPDGDVAARRDGVAVAEFDLETLWDRGGCRDWAQGGQNVTRGRIDRFSADYTAQAWNNTVPRRLVSPILRGSFTGTGTSVDVAAR